MKRLKKDILAESVLLDKLPDDIVQAIVQHRTSLGNNPAIPDIYDIPYMLKAATFEFNEAKEGLKQIGSIDDVQESTINGVLARLLLRCKELETPYRNELEKLCFNYVVDLFAVPEDSVDIQLDLKDEIDTDKESILLDPADGDDYLEFTDLNDAMSIKGEVYKRRFLDALCWGAALDIIQNNDDFHYDLISIDEALPDLYNKINALNKYSLFLKEDLGMTDEQKLQLGTFELKLGTEDEKCRIEAQGVIFPILLCETIRGFLELFISHGLPKDKERAIAVLGKSDFLKSEPWDMRIGPFIWRKVSKALNDVSFNEVPYLFKRISSLEIPKFNFLMKEVLAGTKKGRRIMSIICNKAKDEADYDKFVDKMDKMKKDKGIITDDYIHAEEL